MGLHWKITWTLIFITILMLVLDEVFKITDDLSHRLEVSLKRKKPKNVWYNATGGFLL